MKVVWLRRAAGALDEIHDFLAERSPRAAAKFYNDVLDDVEKLAGSPRMAPTERYLDGRPEEFRSLVVCKTHKVIYHIEGGEIKIALVWDCRRDPAKLREGVSFRK